MRTVSTPSRRCFLRVVGQGALGCAISACQTTAPPAPTPADAAPPADLRPPPPDLLRPRDLSAAPDLTPSEPPPDLAGPQDLLCGGVAVPAALMPALNEARYWAAQRVFIARDSQGYMAVSPTCYHSGCAVVYMPRPDGQGYICPCHGSTYQLDGTLIGGLSILPLDHVSICWQDATKQVILLTPRALLSDTTQRLS